MNSEKHFTFITRAGDLKEEFDRIDVETPKMRKRISVSLRHAPPRCFDESTLLIGDVEIESREEHGDGRDINSGIFTSCLKVYQV